MDTTGLKEKEGTPSHMPGSAPMQTRPASQASTVASVQHGSLSPLQFADGSAPQRFTVSVSRCWLECHSCVATKCMCNAGAHTHSREQGYQRREGHTRNDTSASDAIEACVARAVSTAELCLGAADCKQLGLVRQRHL